VEEISKKDLLVETGISYGQLYRWKRDGLIPEEWFIKRSAFTGQETFFPRDRMLARVQSILALKDTHSLDEIRENLAAKTTVYKLRDTLQAMSDMEADLINSLRAPSTISEVSIETLAAVLHLYEMANRANVEKDRITELIDEAIVSLSESVHLPSMVGLLKTAGEWHFIAASQATWIATDKGIVFIETAQIADVVESMRAKLTELREL